MLDNIFDTAGKHANSKKGKILQEKSLKESAKKSEQIISDSELKEMLQKMQAMKKDLEDQLAVVYQKGKESKINVSLLVENASALNAKQIEKMEEQQKILQDKILAITPPESCLRKNLQSKEKMTQERKGKTRGVRNNWIPVR